MCKQSFPRSLTVLNPCLWVHPGIPACQPHWCIFYIQAWKHEKYLGFQAAARNKTSPWSSAFPQSSLQRENFRAVELWGGRSFKKKLEGTMQMREMSLGKLEELSDVVMKGCQWRWWQLKCISQGCCSNRNRCYSPTCLQTQGLWLRVSCQRKSRENRANGCIVHREHSLLIVLFIKIKEKTQKSEKCPWRLPLAAVFEMRQKALCVGW